MREQALWTEHAAFVNALVDAGFVIAGGPIGDGRVHRAMLIVHAVSESEIRRRLLEDPWIRAGILRVLSIEPWKLLASDQRLDRLLAEITKTNP